ncbi:hypothetical protein HanOQP8_Chr16g0636721 [Helianthus annuus]|nr:hypothetical protein HanLR1_Chr16g0641321 [Helianthus annuus]KAJ0646576.1 hypothetical protein HanOQP8_Chr16g0636721 [Helianthus annuus]
MDLRCRIDGYFVVVGLMMGCLIGTCVNGDSNGDSVGAPMVKTEQDALYSAIQGFVGNWWNGSDLYPDPCGWTPIQCSTLVVAQRLSSGSRRDGLLGERNSV